MVAAGFLGSWLQLCVRHRSCAADTSEGCVSFTGVQLKVIFKCFGELQNEHSVGHHILIIWAEEWAFLQSAVVVLVPCSEFGLTPEFSAQAWRM